MLAGQLNYETLYNFKVYIAETIPVPMISIFSKRKKLISNVSLDDCSSDNYTYTLAKKKLKGSGEYPLRGCSIECFWN